LTSRRTLDTELESCRVNHHPHSSMTTCECLLWTSTFWTEHEHFDVGEAVNACSLGAEHLFNAVISI